MTSAPPLRSSLIMRVFILRPFLVERAVLALGLVLGTANDIVQQQAGGWGGQTHPARTGPTVAVG
jgi:hypothetical protein